ncbi:hypothetical protein RHAA1_02219 [Aggregatibacter actinomycetemcomitans RhAA1]|nr:hypothetical protein RHAA1_02219 [Aggregatibacter actinomycetemcomitans RhAA1]
MIIYLHGFDSGNFVIMKK